MIPMLLALLKSNNVTIALFFELVGDVGDFNVLLKAFFGNIDSTSE